MFRHTLLISLRNFKRYKSSFFINLIGLSSGLACSLLIYLWVVDELSIDKFHEHESRLFQVMEHQQYADEIMTTASTPGLLGETLMEEIPEIEYGATTGWIGNHTLSIEEHSIKAEGFHVPVEYFNIFSYKIIHGDPSQVLKDKNSIVISVALAIRLFGNSDDVVGKEVEYEHYKSYIVSGVFEDIPKNSSYKFEYAISYEDFKDDNEWVKSWGNNGPPTFVLLHERSNYLEVSDKIASFVAERNESSNVTLFLMPYSDRYLYGKYTNGVQDGGRIEYVQLFSAIAVFILIIACINFMNLSTARASRRAREVGVKKAIGAQKGSLVWQYLGESTLITLLSLALALLFVALFLPEFNEITGKQITLDLTPNLILTILSIALLTGLVSGSYPALYLSSFKAIVVLKGELRGSLGELWARRGLVVFQFALSVILIVSVLVVYKQVEFVQNKNLGYDKDNLIMFSLEGNAYNNKETFLNELRRIPGVTSVSSVGHRLLGRNSNTSGLEWQGKNPDDRILFENVRVNYDLLETLEVEMLEGRSFSREYSTDTTKIIINEAAMRVMNLENPIGEHIKLWDEFDLEIIGIVKDFHFQSLHSEVNPLFFWLHPEDTWYVVLRIDGGREKETIDRLNNFYTDYNPGFTFDFHFLDDEYAKQYAAEQRVATLSRYFAGIAILISCLGLFGLAAFTTERRLKEIGIRKILGSSDFQIVRLLTNEFSKMVLVAIVIALPCSYYLVRNWIDKFAYRISLEWWFFIGAGALALLVVWFTVGLQTLKAARVNPAKCLRDE
ncbi:MAG: ABC transporter permease [Cyclobacteriaceae bacterium]|nr:ABC transporter permease [Cyclobacteriaceae bacterium]